MLNSVINMFKKPEPVEANDTSKTDATNCVLNFIDASIEKSIITERKNVQLCLDAAEAKYQREMQQIIDRAEEAKAKVPEEIEKGAEFFKSRIPIAQGLEEDLKGLIDDEVSQEVAPTSDNILRTDNHHQMMVAFRVAKINKDMADVLADLKNKYKEEVTKIKDSLEQYILTHNALKIQIRHVIDKGLKSAEFMYEMLSSRGVKETYEYCNRILAEHREEQLGKALRENIVYDAKYMKRHRMMTIIKIASIAMVLMAVMLGSYTIGVTRPHPVKPVTIDDVKSFVDNASDDQILDIMENTSMSDMIDKVTTPAEPQVITPETIYIHEDDQISPFVIPVYKVNSMKYSIGGQVLTMRKWFGNPDDLSITGDTIIINEEFPTGLVIVNVVNPVRKLQFDVEMVRGEIYRIRTIATK